MRNLKKVLALVVAVAMIASMGLVASAASYSDVAANASYADAVNLLSNLGIIKGYEDGTFKPDNTVTRAEAATMIVRMLALDDEVEAGDTNFTDVAADTFTVNTGNAGKSITITKTNDKSLLIFNSPFTLSSRKFFIIIIDVFRLKVNRKFLSMVKFLRVI